MFDNPEKLFILFVIALLIFGPSKLATLGSSLGRSIRDFRNTVRGAQDEFRAAVEEHVGDSVNTDAFTPGLPSPESEPAGTAMPAEAASIPAGDAVAAETAHGAATDTVADTVEAVSHEVRVENAVPAADDEFASLASEPTAAQLRESLRRT